MRDVRRREDYQDALRDRSRPEPTFSSWGLLRDDKRFQRAAGIGCSQPGSACGRWRFRRGNKKGPGV